MTTSVLVNGAPLADRSHAIALEDRGLHYGDGVFETACVIGGRVRFLEDHLARLKAGCERLRIPSPPRQVLISEIDQIVQSHREGVLKIVVTRGTGPRGYRPPQNAEPTRIVALHPLPSEAVPREIKARWCETRLARNPALAGIKHLNRLENVLAQTEWNDPDIGEGLMLDTEGELVSGTASNVFVVREATLVTPDLRYCGVRGIVRAQVLKAATRLGLATSEEPLWPSDVEAASEIFVTNAIRGLRSIVSLGQLRWNQAPIAERLRTELGL
ncbi:MAG TPA: aminodeoxychorismate lyase [Steroidobacter sp.]